MTSVRRSTLATGWPSPVPLRVGTDVGMAYLQGDPGRLKGLAWLLFNLDEFLYVR